MVKVNGSMGLNETLYMLCKAYLSMCTERFIQFDLLYRNIFPILNARNIFMYIIESRPYYKSISVEYDPCFLGGMAWIYAFH